MTRTVDAGLDQVVDGRRPEFRADIDGLRGIAILLVVLFHCDLTGFEGGFVGVDVFFVISGYLITQRLVAELDETRTVQLGAFWAKRVRRLVPALTLMIATSLLLAVPVLSPLEWDSAANEGAASALYVSNIVYALHSTDYFATGESLFLHTWSLSVEEQFYLVWPLMLVAMVRVRGRLGRSARRVAVGLLLMTAVSFTLSWWLTQRGTPWAFFGLPTRMWEFGVGGVLVLWRSRRPVGVPAVLLGALGMGSILLATASFDDRTPYPGVAALLPVLGTGAIILAGSVDRDRGVPVVLRAAPLQWLGRVSYSWYLWHWPLIVLVVAWTGRDTVPVAVGGALAGLAVAVLALRFVEDPARFRPSLVGSTRRTLAMGAACTVMVLIVAIGVRLAAASAESRPFYRELAAASVSGSDAAGTATALCDPRGPSTVERVCTLGDPLSDRTVMVVGDSHAGHWSPALDAAGERLGVRVVVRNRGGCPAHDVDVAPARGAPIRSRACDSFRDGTRRLLAAERPEAVIVSNAAYPDRVLGDGGESIETEQQVERWRNELARYLHALQRDGVAVGIIQDNPRATFDPIACIARRGGSDGCVVPAHQAKRPVDATNRAQRAVAEELGGVPLFDVTSLLCDRHRCRTEVGDTYVYSDADHLSRQFTASQASGIERFLDEVLADR